MANETIILMEKVIGDVEKFKQDVAPKILSLVEKANSLVAIYYEIEREALKIEDRIETLLMNINNLKQGEISKIETELNNQNK